MPYATKAPTHETLLALMSPGVPYAPHLLAKQVRVPSAQVKLVLVEMAEQGKLSTTRPWKNLCFMLAGTEHLRKQPAPKPEIDRTTLALPRTFAVLTGEIRGYDAEIARRQQLAMMTRGMR
jgi:hypothetical protein